MDLSRFCTKEASEDGAWLDIMDWDGETPIGASILVSGPDSAEAMKISDEMEKESQKQLAAMFAQNKKGAVKDPEPVSTAERILDRAIRLTKGWKDLDIEGREFPFTIPNARWLYENSPMIRDQVLSFHQKRANFTKAGSDNSQKQSATESGSTTRAKAASR